MLLKWYEIKKKHGKIFYKMLPVHPGLHTMSSSVQSWMNMETSCPIFHVHPKFCIILVWNSRMNVDTSAVACILGIFWFYGFIMIMCSICLCWPRWPPVAPGLVLCIGMHLLLPCCCFPIGHAHNASAMPPTTLSCPAVGSYAGRCVPH